MMLNDSKCFERRCLHFIGVEWLDDSEESEVYVCKAFPNGIPKEISYGDNDHTKPFEGDNGIQYERQEEWGKSLEKHGIHDQSTHNPHRGGGGEIAKEVGKSKFDPERSVTIGQVTFDSVDGAGAIGTNANINYEGYVVLMKPDEFLSLNPSRVDEQGVDFLREHVQNGGSVGPPYLSGIYDEGTGKITVRNHEGRGRAKVISEIQPNLPMPVHVTIRRKEAGEDRTLETRARSITPDMTMATIISDPRSTDFAIVRPKATILNKTVYGRREGK